ncbi:MAG: hypothetical protein JNK05_10045 [Myxococcales bacterium]|nr:hypothetical protein [Myxococcales bacterium]
MGRFQGRREILIAACVVAALAGSSGPRSPSPAAPREARVDPATEAPTLALGDWIPEWRSEPLVVESTPERTLLVQGSVRAIVHDDGRIELGRERPRHVIRSWFRSGQGRWVFVTSDGLVLSAQTFTAAFETRAELPSEPDDAPTRSGFAWIAAVRTDGSRWWSLRDPAHPRRADIDSLEAIADVQWLADGREIAVSQAGRVLLRSAHDEWRPVALAGDLALNLKIDPQFNVEVVGLRHRWRLRGDALVRSDAALADPQAPPQTAWRIARWNDFWRRALWSATSAWSSADVRVPVHVYLSLPGRYAEAETIDGRRRAFGLELASTNVGPFGPGGVAYEVSNPFAARRFVVRGLDGTLRDDVTFPEALLIDTPLFASDASVVALPHEDGTVPWWSRATGWRSSSFASSIRWRSTGESALFGDDDTGLVRAALRADIPTATMTTRFDSLGLDFVGGAKVAAFGAAGPVRSWLVASKSDPSRCVALVDDGHHVARVTVPDCALLDEVLFADPSFGVVANESEFRVTRDGAHWQSFAREYCAHCSSASGANSILLAQDGIVVPPSHRVSRAIEASDAGIIRRAAGIDGDEYVPPSSVHPSVDCRSIRASTTASFASPGARLMVVDDASGPEASVRWRANGGPIRRWAGVAPWERSRAGDSVTWTPRVLDDRGAVFERCVHREDALAQCAVYMASPAGVLVDVAFQSRPTAIALNDVVVERSDGGVVFFLGTRDERGYAQWQQRRWDGSIVAWGEMLVDSWVHGLAKTERGWGVVLERGGRSVFRAFADNADEWFDAEVGEACGGPIDDERIFYARIGAPRVTFDDDEASGVVAELRPSNGVWCVSQLRTATGGIALTPASGFDLSLRPARDGRFFGDVTHVRDGRIERRALQCTRVWRDGRMHAII